MASPRDRRSGLGVPLLVVNLKAYPTVFGERALRIGRAVESEARAAGVSAAVCPPATELSRMSRRLRIPVLAQHVDPVDAGARTGSVPAEALAAAGVRGSLVNHSERPIPDRSVGEAVRRLRAVGLASIVCAGDLRSTARLARFRPDFVAIEPPELIGGDRSVSTARPEIVSAAVRAVRRVSPRTKVLCGAGVHDRTDVASALRLGSRGVLVASAVARAQRPALAVRELMRGFSLAG
ncbi:MAG: triose-phosphate isomerase [Thermoplasmata archaeon]